MNDQYLADMLHRLGARARADLGQQGVPRHAVGAGDANLDELVGFQRPIDLLEHAARQSSGAYNDDRAQRVGPGAQLPSEMGVHERR